MKTRKKHKLILPDVHILGDLQDVQNLVAGVNKKKTVVIFRDAEQGLHYAEIDGEIQQFPLELINNLGKEYRFIFFDFFPGKKREVAPVAEPAPEPAPEPEVQEPVSNSVKKKKLKKEKKEKPVETVKKVKKAKKTQKV